jgi:hypothetical protein
MDRYVVTPALETPIYGVLSEETITIIFVTDIAVSVGNGKLRIFTNCCQ